ncbi:MAG: BrnA antitoxin family protein [Gemmatimonadota bacterium]
MRFDWDATKEATNIAGRQLPFSVAQRIFDGTVIRLVDRRKDYPLDSSRQEGANDVSGRNTGKPPRTNRPKVAAKAKTFDWSKLDAMSDREIEATSPPELANLPDDFFDDVEVVRPVTKEAISLRVDRAVLEFFRGGGVGYQSRMNAVLRHYVERVRSAPSVRAKRRKRAL